MGFSQLSRVTRQNTHEQVSTGGDFLMVIPTLRWDDLSGEGVCWLFDDDFCFSRYVSWIDPSVPGFSGFYFDCSSEDTVIHLKTNRFLSGIFDFDIHSIGGWRIGGCGTSR